MFTWQSSPKLIKSIHMISIYANNRYTKFMYSVKFLSTTNHINKSNNIPMHKLFSFGVIENSTLSLAFTEATEE